ncbi:hypothetical protein [Rhizobium rhizosphaerae]|uniref:hypothetical protein n=1 Tax=Xaviernesmea rhizosphaerae TaxID=1672749 RepID=UPI000A711223|nr:hypothetical protein [Xaviernesmea rhizosphaerae]
MTMREGGKQREKRSLDTADVDHTGPAGLYIGRKLKGSSGIRYRRFSTVTEALRFAIEEMPASQLRGSCLEVEEQRFNGAQIRSLYDAGQIPRLRQPF